MADVCCVVATVEIGLSGISQFFGDDAGEAMPQFPQLLNGAVAVLLQCHGWDRATDAAKAGIDWLTSVFAAPTPVALVVALHRHQCGQV